MEEREEGRRGREGGREGGRGGRERGEEGGREGEERREGREGGRGKSRIYLLQIWNLAVTHPQFLKSVPCLLVQPAHMMWGKQQLVVRLATVVRVRSHYITTSGNIGNTQRVPRVEPLMWTL